MTRNTAATVVDREAALAATGRARQAATVLERSVCVTLECHFLGNDRKVDLEELVRENGGEMVVDKDQFTSSRKLIDRKELAPCMRVISLAKSYLRRVAISTHRVFGERSYLLPLALVEEADAQLAKYATDLHAEAMALSLRYRDAMERQRIAQGPLFRARDYATPEQVVAAFGIDWAYVSFAAPDRLETVSRALAQAAHRKHQQRLADAYDEVVAGLRTSAVDILHGLADRLAPGPDGRKKTLRETALRDLTEFVRVLPARNLGDDSELQAIMQHVAARARGLDVEQLREDEVMRKALAEAATQAAAAVEGLIEKAPRRGMALAGSL